MRIIITVVVQLEVRVCGKGWLKYMLIAMMISSAVWLDVYFGSEGIE